MRATESWLQTVMVPCARVPTDNYNSCSAEHRPWWRMAAMLALSTVTRNPTVPLP